MIVIQDHIGEIHWPYIIVGIAPQKDTDGHTLYLAHCILCDAVRKMRLNDICHNRSQRNNCSAIHLKNGIDNKRLRQIFKDMKRRCYDSKHKDYKNYGKKGIRVCFEWLKNPNSFAQWAFEFGYAEDLTIDRIDANKNYCPENCRWISQSDNARYKSTTQVIDVDGKVLTGKQWAEMLGLDTNTINTIRRKSGEEITKMLIREMLKRKPYIDIQRKRQQSWLDAYDIVDTSAIPASAK